MGAFIDRGKKLTQDEAIKELVGITDSPSSESILDDAKDTSKGLASPSTKTAEIKSEVELPKTMKNFINDAMKWGKIAKKKAKATADTVSDTYDDFRGLMDPDTESGYAATKAQMERGTPKEPPTRDQTRATYAGSTARTVESVGDLTERFPNMPAYQVDAIFQGESGGVSTAKNPKTNASGLWQVMGNALKDLRDLGYVDKKTTLADVRAMSKADQIGLYGDYLDRWDYDGSESLGMMQAAPALAKKAVNNPDMVVYKKGSTAWDQNKPWRPADGGDITPRSIDEYYFGSAPETSLRPKKRPFVEKKV